MSVGTLDSPKAIQLLEKLKSQMEGEILGQESLIEESLVAFLANGHVLMTGAPGLAKTTLVRSLSVNLGLQFNRIQFTPDLLPADIIGTEFLNLDPESGKRSFKFSKGPIFTSLLLADEINRASPRTQAAMLEAMQENRVTVAGHTHELPSPFMVFATQNPFESEGTFPLPEAQLDRFLLHILVDYPKPESEVDIYSRHINKEVQGSSDFSLHAEEVLTIQKMVDDVEFPEELVEVVAELVGSSRPSDSRCPGDLKSFIWYGAGPRAGLSLVAASKALAFLNQDSQVRWKHVQQMAYPVLRHRIRLSPEGAEELVQEDQIISHLLERLTEKHRGILQNGA